MLSREFVADSVLESRPPIPRRISISGDMRKRWTAAGMLVAEQPFRWIIGYRDLPKLVIAIKPHTMLVASKNHDRQQLAQPVTV
jgi:hypothetical protein